VNLSVKQSPNYKMGTSVREKYYLKDKYKHDLPASNIYNPNYEKTRSKAPATGLGYGERSVMSKTFASPGPGTYQSPTSIGEGPTYILGARFELSYEHKKDMEMPSPFQYKPNFDALSKTQSVFSIGKAKRAEITGPRRLNVPGPGTYIGEKLNLAAT
jgi:Sperm-tail PG-rich repeat